MALLKQDYAEVGQLQLAGVRVADRLTLLNATKEISHPRDRFMPKYRRSITLQDIMRSQTRRSYSGLAREIYNPPYSIIFTCIEETSTGFELMNMTCAPDSLDLEFSSFLAGSNYVFAYVESGSETSLELDNLHLLVPRNASLDDIVVSLYGSQCLHLLRPIPIIPPKYKYLGPITGIACGLEQTQKYTQKNKFGFKELPKSFRARETFVLV